MTQASSPERSCLWTGVSPRCKGNQLENSDLLRMRAHLQSLATWMQKLRSFFETLRLDDIAFCKLERFNHSKDGSATPAQWDG